MLQYIGYYGELLLRRLYYYNTRAASVASSRHAQTVNEFFRDFKKTFWSNFLKYNFGTYCTLQYIRIVDIL